MTDPSCPRASIGDLDAAQTLSRQFKVSVLVMAADGTQVCEQFPDGTRRQTRAGRNPVAGVARSAKIQLGITPAEHGAYTKAARDAGWSTNEWIRRACAAALE
jgi:hypothetical protein